MTEIDISIKSLDGRWTFDGNRIRSAGANIEPFTIDFFRRWTFARFLPGNILTLGFESDQPYSDYGSYGDRYGGVQVLVLKQDPLDWDLVAIEFDYRRFDEEYIPNDVVWHKRGILAWLHDETLCIQVLKAPRSSVVSNLLPQRDSDCELEYAYYFSGQWKRLDIAANGNEMTAVDQDGMEYFDLLGKRRSRDGTLWEEWDEAAESLATRKTT